MQSRLAATSGGKRAMGTRSAIMPELALTWIKARTARFCESCFVNEEPRALDGAFKMQEYAGVRRLQPLSYRVTISAELCALAATGGRRAAAAER
jgi:hypothetical protein